MLITTCSVVNSLFICQTYLVTFKSDEIKIKKESYNGINETIFNQLSTKKEKDSIIYSVPRRNVNSPRTTLKDNNYLEVIVFAAGFSTINFSAILLSSTTGASLAFSAAASAASVASSTSA